MTSPDIEWLQRRWALPENAEPAVMELLREELNGSTACKLEEPIPAWGNAVSSTHGDSLTPLVVVEHDGHHYLQSRRLYCAEQDIARRLLEMAANENMVPGTAPDDLFPGVAKTDLQLQAARVALSRQLTILTGGPGTGKTYTLARILSLLVISGIPPELIRLAAPTGKAADRMKSAVSESLSGLPDSFQSSHAALSAIADSSATLHKLLPYHSRKSSAGTDSKGSISCRVLIVDECSMVDVLMWQALLQALPSDVRLVLIGDPNQLESVGKGNVFTELVRAAENPESCLHPALVHLTEARRFKDRPAIRAFAKALENSDAAAAVELLENARGTAADEGLAWIDTPNNFPNHTDLPPPILSAIESVALAQTPEAALTALSKICILTAQRQYFVGSMALSEAIGAHFSKNKKARNSPIIINHNDPETGLRNGVVGVIHTGPEGEREAWFPTGDGKLKNFQVATLPDYSPAWAITIHRSQGSEFDEVLVILPREDSPMATRELLYTAITRAKRKVYVVGDLASVRKAIITRSRRVTLLSAVLTRSSA